MAAYYYLMSSLPMLRAAGEAPFSYAAFLELCRSGVDDDTYRYLEALSVDTCEGALMAQWAKFYGVLAQELTYQRSVRLGKPCNAPLNRDEDAVRIVNAVLAEKNPLEAEKMLLKLEFEKLDELLSMHYFDASALIGYALKLKLLERKTVFVQEKGRVEFDRLLDLLQQQIMSI